LNTDMVEEDQLDVFFWGFSTCKPCETREFPRVEHVRRREFPYAGHMRSRDWFFHTGSVR
jgi:hypothetical protein